MSNDKLALHISQLTIGDSQNQLPQTIHRLAITNAWDTIKPGDGILELGCGQGDMTAVLASLVGPTGRIAALDPADPEAYGAPWTLKQAQTHLSLSVIGAQIEWIQSDTIEYLEKTKEEFDAVVLAQCLWYFPSTTVIEETLASIKKLKGSPKLLLAEYALESRLAEGLPHVLAALAQATLEVHKPVSTSNIRTLISPRAIIECATSLNWKLVSEQKITPDIAYQDGRWEVGAVLVDGFVEEAKEFIHDDRGRSVVLAMRDSVLSSAAHFERKALRSMDVWVAVFV